MFLYSWGDLVMAARIFHTTNIGELAEALEPDDDERDTAPDQRENRPHAIAAE